MPYINPKDRPALDNRERSPQTVGELNYVLTTLCITAMADTPARYPDRNAVVDALERTILGLAGANGGHLYNMPYDWLAGALQMTVSKYIRDHGPMGVAGAVRCCQLEFYRRNLAPYEDQAIKRNGDVYP